jgi:hypothetical protein
MQALKDDIWQFVGVVVAIVGLFFNALAFPDITTRLIGIFVVLFLAIGIFILSKNIPRLQGKPPASKAQSNPPVNVKG